MSNHNPRNIKKKQIWALEQWRHHRNPPDWLPSLPTDRSGTKQNLTRISVVRLSPDFGSRVHVPRSAHLAIHPSDPLSSAQPRPLSPHPSDLNPEPPRNTPSSRYLCTSLFAPKSHHVPPVLARFVPRIVSSLPLRRTTCQARVHAIGWRGEREAWDLMVLCVFWHDH